MEYNKLILFLIFKLNIVNRKRIGKNQDKLKYTEVLLSILKSVRVHFAYGRIALALELLGQFGRFLDDDDRCNLPVLLF